MSTASPPATPSPRRDSPANRWHRNAGVVVAAVLVYLLVTGVGLQFSSELGLGQRHVSATWILDWYGLEAPEVVFKSDDVAQVGDRLFLDGRFIATMSDLAGTVQLPEFTLVAGSHELLVVYRDAGRSVERTHMTGAVNRLGTWQGRPYLDTDQGLLTADALLINWRPAEAPPGGINWAVKLVVVGSEAASYRNAFRIRMLTIERWLQDLHSGRFFGLIGVLIIDLATALLLVLAGTGLLLWWRFRRG
ncbi:MAG: PepSY domain-containing protein [Gammaproteobacteria bacterium]|nr:PepSY domain-containing protein [Gammaproteobacteria bacterium]